MVSKGHALSRDALVRTLTSYTGITSADGADDGTTLVDSNLKDNAVIAPTSIPEKTILIMSGDARGEDKGSESFDNGTGTITLQGTGFSHQIKAGTVYRILNISTTEMDVARIEAKLDGANTDLDTLLVRLSAAKSSYLNELAPAHIPADIDTLLTRLSDYRAGLLNYLTELGAAHIPADIDTLLARLTAARAGNLDYLTELAAAHIPADIDTLKAVVAAIKGATGIFYEQASVALDVSVGNAEADLFDLSAASTRYIVRSLRVKCADPGPGETVTIRLYELINITSTLIGSFVIDHDNFMTYFSLMDMFGVPQLAGDDLHVVAIGSVAGPVALTGRYSYAKTNV